MDFNYTVRDQRIIKATSLNGSILRSGTRGVANLVFSFDEERLRYPAKAVGFSHSGADCEDYEPIREYACLIPDKYCDSDFYIKVVGSDGTRRMTTKVEVE